MRDRQAIALPATRAAASDGKKRKAEPQRRKERKGLIWSRLTLITQCVIMQYMIRSFKCEYTEALSKGHHVRKFVNIARVARRKLRQLEIANRLEDLKVPPGNRLKALRGNRSGQYSIRINDQWRVCFLWTEEGADGVEIVDYH